MATGEKTVSLGRTHFTKRAWPHSLGREVRKAGLSCCGKGYRLVPLVKDQQCLLASCFRSQMSELVQLAEVLTKIN